MRHRIVTILLAMGLAAAGARAQNTAQQHDVIVKTSLDRTAIWVADRVTYTIDLTCKRGVDVLVDDLSRDQLKLDGLEVVESSVDRQSTHNGDTVYHFRYVLTTYRVDASTLTIAPVAVRYAVRRAGELLTETAPAGEVQVPGATVTFRSVLPDDAEVSALRSDPVQHQRPRRFAALSAIGIGLVIVAVGPVLFAAVGFARRSRPSVVAGPLRIHRSQQAARRDERESLEALHAINIDGVDGRREVFTRLDAIVREHLGRAYGLDAASLTPLEVPAAVAAHSAKVPAELVATVLGRCELARYAPPAAIPSAEACRDALSKVEEIVGR